jgi:hypothetical protein
LASALVAASTTVTYPALTEALADVADALERRPGRRLRTR